MIGINGGECCHYLGGNSMLNILICDDDKTMIEAMISIVENVLAESDKKAKIFEIPAQKIWKLKQ